MAFPFHANIHPASLRGPVWVIDRAVTVARVDAAQTGAGQVTVFIPGLGDQVRELFEHPHDMEGRALPAWTPESLHYILDYGLRQRGLAADPAP